MGADLTDKIIQQHSFRHVSNTSRSIQEKNNLKIAFFYLFKIRLRHCQQKYNFKNNYTIK